MWTEIGAMKFVSLLSVCVGFGIAPQASIAPLRAGLSSMIPREISTPLVRCKVVSSFLNIALLRKWAEATSETITVLEGRGLDLVCFFSYSGRRVMAVLVYKRSPRGLVATHYGSDIDLPEVPSAKWSVEESKNQIILRNASHAKVAILVMSGKRTRQPPLPI
jgi:hypothetical protein